MTFLSVCKTLIEDDETGALYIRYQPVLDGALTTMGSGEFTFAAYDCLVGDPPENHAAQQRSALASAVGTLRHIADTTARELKLRND